MDRGYVKVWLVYGVVSVAVRMPREIATPWKVSVTLTVFLTVLDGAPNA